MDPVGEAVRHQIEEFGTKVGPIRTSRIFLIDTDASEQEIARVARELLADPIVESSELFVGGKDATHHETTHSRIEIHLKPGVMDPVAASTQMAMRDMGLNVREVRTGRAYLIAGQIPKEELQRIASRVLANGVIESVHFDAYVPDHFQAGKTYALNLRHIPLLDLDDEALKKLSRTAHLFLSLEEMQTIQSHFRELKREPTDIELETLAQTWSEHCVHKTLKSAVDVEVQDSTGKTTSTRHYGNLIKETIFQSTMELMNRGTGGPPVVSSDHGRAAHATSPEPFCLSVFADNAGVIAFDETDAVCFKVETHNHPSAIEPYGGSATGAGGCIRDILGTGLAAKPVANTDVFCVAFPDLRNKDEVRRMKDEKSPSDSSFTLHPSSLSQTSLPRGVIHPKRILQQVVAGVRDYGNRMGIPTVNGAVYFDNRYLGNPLVFCGCVGLIPRDKINKAARPGDAIVVMGGRTGRDGIHGATFSSAELTDTHADEFSHAVQIGNAITQKKMADVILQARDQNLFSGITDCGAGGLSSAIGEMGEKVGARVELHEVPLKYAGLRHDEIWISEAQERMVLSVPPEHVQSLLDLAESEDVEATVIGTFGTEGRELILNYAGQEVGRLKMSFLHDGIPMSTRKAVVEERVGSGQTSTSSVESWAAGSGEGVATSSEAKARLLNTLAHPNVASKHWVIRQYDHEVQGGSVIKPLIGPMQIGPSDASVIRPKLDSIKGVAIGCGLTPGVADPYWMAIAAIDEAIRNVVCVGADPSKVAILDNFCWPSVDDEVTMGTLVAACEACRDAALAYGIPFISGKDSLHNQFTNQETGEVLRIPNTLLISAIGVLDDITKCVTMDFKRTGGQVCMISTRNPASLTDLAATHRALASAIANGWIASCHDVSDGGAATAAAEMAIASGLGLTIDAAWIQSPDTWAEVPGRYLVELCGDTHVDTLAAAFPTADVAAMGIVQPTKTLALTTNDQPSLQIPLDELTKAWRGTLDW